MYCSAEAKKNRTQRICCITHNTKKKTFIQITRAPREHIRPIVDSDHSLEFTSTKLSNRLDNVDCLMLNER